MAAVRHSPAVRVSRARFISLGAPATACGLPLLLPCPSPLSKSRRAQPPSLTSLGLDEEQVRLMAERVIMVDWNDKRVGAASKEASHRWQGAYPGILAGGLHRAFSVFLFTPDGRLVLQQVGGRRAAAWLLAPACRASPFFIFRPPPAPRPAARGVQNHLSADLGQHVLLAPAGLRGGGGRGGCRGRQGGGAAQAGARAGHCAV
jgi:hypothetical protein